MGARLVIRSIDGRTVEEEVGYPFDQGRVVIGRGRSADVRIPHRTVSELHATLSQEHGGFSLCDEGSTNGTRVNGEALVPHRGRRLHDGDLIEAGVYLLAFRTDALVTEPLSADRTGELARQLLRRGREGSAGAKPPTLSVIGGPGIGRTLSLGPPPARYVIGSAEDCQLSVPDAALSARQLELVHDLDGVTLRDTEDRPTLRASGQPVSQQRLRDGDEVLVAATRLLFEEPAQAGLDTLADGDDDSLPGDYRVPFDPPAPAEPVAEEAPEPASKEPPTPPRTRRAQSSIGADLVIYGLAAAILAVSVAALVVLMGSN